MLVVSYSASLIKLSSHKPISSANAVLLHVFLNIFSIISLFFCNIGPISVLKIQCLEI